MARCSLTKVTYYKTIAGTKIWKVEFSAAPTTQMTNLTVNTVHLIDGDKLWFVDDEEAQNPNRGPEHDIKPGAGNETTIDIDAGESMDTKTGVDKDIAQRTTFYVEISQTLHPEHNDDVLWVDRR
jgi:hypothetical protein